MRTTISNGVSVSFTRFEFPALAPSAKKQKLVYSVQKELCLIQQTCIIRTMFLGFKMKARIVSRHAFQVPREWLLEHLPFGISFQHIVNQ